LPGVVRAATLPLLAVAAAVQWMAVSPSGEHCLFAGRLRASGIGALKTLRREPCVSRGVNCTGRTRPTPMLPAAYSPLARPEFGINYGWNQETGKWMDMEKGFVKKWWQYPGYLTPNGYRENPCWNLKNYRRVLTELKFAKTEANMVQILKTKGWTYKEIKARASTYEFIEDDDTPKMTSKMMGFMQIKALYDGKEEELIDLRETPAERSARLARIEERREEKRKKEEEKEERAKGELFR